MEFQEELYARAVAAVEVEVRAPREGDVEVLAELRAEVLRADLERLGRYDELGVRRRLRDSFSVEHSSVLVVGGQVVGCFTVRPDQGGLLLEHFYLAAEYQGQGIGSGVLRGVLERADAQGMTVRLNVLRGSAAQGLYERYGFVVEVQDEVDVFMVRAAVRRVGSMLPSGIDS
ncbi:GNAT family N-acetyltransferase [Streptomyces sp. NPDC003038]|uniref:GNAT family N-acetyltransferase n=1 Tax=unclassified Streptomyces TaxID=2593676 RepID=UPI0033A5B6AB